MWFSFWDTNLSVNINTLTIFQLSILLNWIGTVTVFSVYSVTFSSFPFHELVLPSPH